MKEIWPNPKAKKPKIVNKSLYFSLINLISRNTSPNKPKDKATRMNTPNKLLGLLEDNHATRAVVINNKEVKPFNTTAIFLFSNTLKIRKAIKETIPKERGIIQKSILFIKIV